MKISFDTKDLEETKKVLPVLTRDLSLRGSEQPITNTVGKAVGSQFASLGRRGSTPWPALKDGSGRPPLQNKGTLKNTASNPKFSLVNGGKEIEITFSGQESNLIAIHSFGALIRRQTKQGSRTIKIPARPILALIEKDIDAIAESAFINLAQSISKKLN